MESLFRKLHLPKMELNLCSIIGRVLLKKKKEEEEEEEEGKFV